MNLVTCLGFEPGACMYLAALTTESSQLVELMVKETHNGLVRDLNPGMHIYLAALTIKSNSLKLWEELLWCQLGPGHMFIQAGDYDRTWERSMSAKEEESQ